MNFAPIHMMDVKTGTAQEFFTLSFPTTVIQNIIPVWLLDSFNENDENDLLQVMNMAASHFLIRLDKCANPRIVREDGLAPRFLFDYLSGLRELQNDAQKIYMI